MHNEIHPPEYYVGKPLGDCIPNGYVRLNKEEVEHILNLNQHSESTQNILFWDTHSPRVKYSTPLFNWDYYAIQKTDYDRIFKNVPTQEESIVRKNTKLLLHVYLTGLFVTCLALSMYVNLIDISFYQVLGISILWPLFAVKYLAIGIWWIIIRFETVLIEGIRVLLGTR